MVLLQPGWSEKKLKQFFLLSIIALCTVSFLGCANHSARTKELLASDYQSMSDDDLTLYYYQLEDQIELVEHRNTSPSLSLGLGLGRFGTRSGASGGVGVSTGASGREIATELRERRNQVKLELKHRGISP